ncbi:MAG: hypothetical protein ACRECX_04920 [Methyloceanibacter sp.]|uniref:hypothetical protein n=1 Tax=Methyloceanibacter sp. TaxID=1965321 RepID=UPI003D6D5D21
MKVLISVLTLAMTLGVAIPAFAGKYTTKAACEAAGGTWNAEAGKCSKKRSGGY